VVGGYLGEGYGHPTRAGQHARTVATSAGVALEDTYGAKAFAALTLLSASFRRICFWHTFDQRLVSDSPSEHPLLRTARGYAESMWPHQRST
jgi:hypothetical protein